MRGRLTCTMLGMELFTNGRLQLRPLTGRGQFPQIVDHNERVPDVGCFNGGQRLTVHRLDVQTQFARQLAQLVEFPSRGFASGFLGPWQIVPHRRNLDAENRLSACMGMECRCSGSTGSCSSSATRRRRNPSSIRTWFIVAAALTGPREPWVYRVPKPFQPAPVRLPVLPGWRAPCRQSADISQPLTLPMSQRRHDLRRLRTTDGQQRCQRMPQPMQAEVFR